MFGVQKTLAFCSDTQGKSKEKRASKWRVVLHCLIQLYLCYRIGRQFLKDLGEILSDQLLSAP
jgi:hypothetical protein